MSLKAQFEQRKQDDNAGLPTDTHPLRMHNDRQARAELAAAVESGDTDRITAAKAALEACYVPLELRALPPEQMEDLRKRHQPTEAQEKAGSVLYNPVTFPPALVAVSVVDSDITEADWTEYMTKGPLAPGEAVALFNACWDVNYPQPDPWLPKEWTGTPQLMLELDYCVPNGIPFSEFRSWSTVDRDMALSWLVRKMEECPACHTRGKEWDPRQGGHHHAYVPQVRGCEGCIATSRGEKAEAETLKAVAGRRIVLVPNPMLRPRRSGLWRGQ